MGGKKDIIFYVVAANVMAPIAELAGAGQSECFTLLFLPCVK